MYNEIIVYFQEETRRHQARGRDSRGGKWATTRRNIEHTAGRGDCERERTKERRTREKEG